MNRLPDPLVIRGSSARLVHFQIGDRPIRVLSHGTVARTLASIDGETFAGGEWLNESDLTELDRAMKRHHVKHDEEPHVYVPDWSNEGRCVDCERLPGHCTGGAA